MVFQPFNGAVQGIKDKAQETVSTTSNTKEEVFETIGGVDSRDVASDPVPDTNEELIGIEDAFGATAREIANTESDATDQKVQDLIKPLPSLPQINFPDPNLPEVNLPQINNGGNGGNLIQDPFKGVKETVGQVNTTLKIGAVAGLGYLAIKTLGDKK